MNAGRVELDLVAVGKDQVSAMLRNIESQAKKTAGEMDKVAKSTGGFGDKLGELKDSIAPINKAREAFENLKGNAMMAVGAFAGVVAILTEISTALNGNAADIVAWEGALKDVVGAIDATAQATRELNIELGIVEPATSLQKALDRVGDRLLDLQEKYSLSEAAVAAYNAELEKLAAVDGALAGVATWAGTLSRLEEDRNLALTRALELTEGLTEASLAYAKGLEEVAKQAARARAVTAAYAMTPKEAAAAAANQSPVGIFPDGWNPNAWDPNAPTLDLGAVDGRKPRGGGGRDAAPWRDPGINLSGAPFAQLISGGPDGEQDAIRPFTGEIVRVRSEFELLTEAVKDFSDTLGPVFEELLPGMGDAFSGVDTIMQAFAETTEKTAKAQVQAALTGSTAVLGGIGKVLGGRKGEWTAMAIAEGAASLASFAVGDLWGGGKHLAAAAGYTAAAAAAGGGGGGARSGGGGGGASGGNGGGSSGPTTIVNNFSMGIGDRQTIMQAQRQADRSARGTGIGARSGV